MATNPTLLPTGDYMIIKTVVQTFFPDNTYRNNTIEMPIPWKAGILIYKQWVKAKSTCSSDKIIGKYFAKNQTGCCYLIIPKEFNPNGYDDIIAGITNMCTQETQDDTFTKEYEENE